jgi:uncharacterized protein YndB with AHSA1/START domain
MPTESIQVSARFPVTPDELFQAWLDSDQHSLFTGGRARIDPSVGGRFSAWADYISGRTLEIEPGRRVVQAWRTIEFPLEAPDSRLEARFESENGGTRLILVHSGIPEGQSDHYEEGWISTYFEPMQRYFRWRGASGAGRAGTTARRVRKAAAKRTVAKRARKTASQVRKAAGRKVARTAAGRKRVRKAVGRKVARKVVRKKVARRTVRKKVVRTAARRTMVRKAVRRKVVRATARTRRARARR